MQRVLAAIGLVCLAGCAMTSQEIRSAAEPLSIKTALPPRDAANCIARNAEQDVGWSSRVEQEGLRWTVHIIQPNFGPIAVVDVEDSSAVWRFRTGVPLVQSRFAEPWTKGC